MLNEPKTKNANLEKNEMKYARTTRWYGTDFSMIANIFNI